MRVDEENQVYFVIKDSSDYIYVEDCCYIFQNINNENNHEIEVDGFSHIDNYIDSFSYFGKEDDKEREMVDYSKFFFLLKRLPAYMQIRFEPWIKEFKLFCIYKGKKYRVTGCSRMGDIWLNKNFSDDHGYDHRVMIDEVTNFTRE